jgi:hypothetical protein
LSENLETFEEKRKARDFVLKHPFLVGFGTSIIFSAGYISVWKFSIVSHIQFLRSFPFTLAVLYPFAIMFLAVSLSYYWDSDFDEHFKGAMVAMVLFLFI